MYRIIKVKSYQYMTTVQVGHITLCLSLCDFSGGSRNSRRGDLARENFEATPNIHLATPISKSLEAFLCFCRGAATIFDHKSR